MVIDTIETMRSLAADTYHVDPGIFILLMFVSVPPYYWGWFTIIRETVNFRKRYKDKSNKLKVSDILLEKNFLLPLFVNRAAWVLPYLYVVFWGSNIPTWFWFAFFGWILLSSYLFWNKLRKKLGTTRKESHR